jgi:predicted nucleotide-binding protein
VARPPGHSNRNYPPLTLVKSLAMAQAIQDGASGMPVDRLTLSVLLNKSPSSSGFITLVLSSRAYGLTTGGKNASEFALTALGREAVSDDPDTRIKALRKAVLAIEPFRTFLTAHDTKKLPVPAAFRAFLTGKASVPGDRAEEAMGHLLSDAAIAQMTRMVKGAVYIDIQNADIPIPESGDEEIENEDDEGLREDEVLVAAENGGPPEETPVVPSPPKRPAAIFIGHGKNKKPLEQLRKILEEYKIPHTVVVDEANAGRPISQKVADAMDECGAAILIFTADQEFQDGDGNTVFRPSENVVYELGAASAKYGSRIIIFKEESVDFPTNFRDIGHISFAKDQLDAKGMELFRELIQFGLVTFSVPSE